ncbi:FimV/HubP-related protein [Massilia sp. S19_KUP03_FR1]|uniref:FimV/HubP-related protein n=1 Tax=Massilia sp. S19_KUP03_FR1 TaxID=3025503 RepID=UPI002FCCDD03
MLISSMLAVCAGAAELGEPRVSSWRGQALVADIELSGLDDPAAPVHVRVASADVYRGASVSVPALLSTLTLSVLRKDGKQFVHVVSSRPVDTEMLLLFLELGQGAQKDVRLATLWLTPDPRPAPPPPPPIAVAPPLAPAPVSAPVPAVAPPAPPLPLHLARVSTSLPASLRPAPPGACKASASNSACAILDKKNVALQAKLVGLEDKIKLLQATLVPAEPAPVAPIATIKPAPAPVAVLVTPKKPKPVVRAPSATPWLWIGVAALVALAAIGAIVFLLLRRRRGKTAPDAPAGPKSPGFLDGIKKRLRPGKAAKAEPVLEEA